MNTIKFQSSEKRNLYLEDENQEYVPAVNLYEAFTDQSHGIFHRPFMLNSRKEWDKWCKEHLMECSNTVVHFPGKHPGDELNKQDFNCYFHFLTFWDKSGNFHRCVIFCAECFIMNEAGQTTDSFNA